MMATENFISSGQRLRHARKNRSLTLQEKMILESKGIKNISSGKGITQTEVSALTGISQPALALYENDRSPVDKNKMILARFYNTTVSDLFF